MIYESWYWKRELARQIKEFETWGPRFAELDKPDDWNDRCGFRLERNLFFSAVAIRRLIDSNKLTDRLRGKSLVLEAFKAKVHKPHTVRSLLGSVDISKWFEMEKPERVNMDPYALASEILHSFTLEFFIDRPGGDIQSILVASKRNQFDRAIAVSRGEWLGLLRDVVADNVVRSEIVARRDGRDPEIKLS